MVVVRYVNRGVEIFLFNKRPLFNHIPSMEFTKIRSIGQTDNYYSRNRQWKYQKFERFQSAVLMTSKRSRIRVFMRFECLLYEHNFVRSFLLEPSSTSSISDRPEFLNRTHV